MIAESVIPAFARGARFRFDGVRDTWVVLAPERMFQPDEHAVEVLKLVDGKRDLGAILDDLCARFDAPRDVVAADVSDMLQGLAERGVLKL
jgi:pyrroloquinoline quinone biosynthesis protein D